MARRPRLWPLVLTVSLLSVAGAAAAQQVLAARTLRAGTVIAASDLVWPATDAGAARARVARLVGLETRRAVYAGRPLDEADLGPPVLVRRNSVVAMVYRDRGLGIRAEGRSLDSGGEGERVRVINLGSRQQVDAIVTGPDSVEVRR